MVTVTLDVPVPADEIPRVVDVSWCAKTFGMTRRGVLEAVSHGNLPATRVGNAFAIDPLDAIKLWSHRLFKNN